MDCHAAVSQAEAHDVERRRGAAAAHGGAKARKGVHQLARGEVPKLHAAVLGTDQDLQRGQQLRKF